MATTPSDQSTKLSSKRKRTDNPAKKRRPVEQVSHGVAETDPVDDAVERRLPARQLQARIRRLSREVFEALGSQSELWMRLEVALNELKVEREAAYFDLGFEHGFAAGRSSVDGAGAGVSELAARLRDIAVQHGERAEALAAVLEVARALAVEPGTGTGEKTAGRAEASKKRYAAAAGSAAARGNIIRDAASLLH